MSAETAAPAAFGDALSIASEVATGARSATSVLQEHLGRISEHEDSIHAFNVVTSDRAIAAAQAIDERIAAGDEVGPLAGVPVAIKDLSLIHI